VIEDEVPRINLDRKREEGKATRRN